MTSRPKLWFSTTLADLRYCFVCGSGLEHRAIPQDKRKRLVCSSCLHITYTNPKTVAGFIPIMPDGRVALLQRDLDPARGKWSYPAGYQELGETVADAAVRETMEEICVKSRAEKLLGVYSYADTNVVTIVYVGRVLRGQRPKPGVESLDVRLFRPTEIPWKELAFRSTVDALKDWIKTR